MLCLLGVILAVGCSGGGGGFTESGEVVGEGMLKIRWFPVDDASGYLIEAVEDGGAVLKRETAIPIECEHRRLEGYTAGLCVYYFDVSPFRQTNFRLEVSAYNESGEGVKTPVLVDAAMRE